MFYNWYFQNRTKQQITAFLSPFFLNLVKEDAHFNLQSLLKDARTVPSTIIENWEGPANRQIIYTNIELIP